MKNKNISCAGSNPVSPSAFELSSTSAQGRKCFDTPPRKGCSELSSAIVSVPDATYRAHLSKIQGDIVGATEVAINEEEAKKGLSNARDMFLLREIHAVTNFLQKWMTEEYKRARSVSSVRNRFHRLMFHRHSRLQEFHSKYALFSIIFQQIRSTESVALKADLLRLLHDNVWKNKNTAMKILSAHDAVFLKLWVEVNYNRLFFLREKRLMISFLELAVQSSSSAVTPVIQGTQALFHVLQHAGYLIYLVRLLYFANKIAICANSAGDRAVALNQVEDFGMRMKVYFSAGGAKALELLDKHSQSIVNDLVWATVGLVTTFAVHATLICSFIVAGLYLFDVLNILVHAIIRGKSRLKKHAAICESIAGQISMIACSFTDPEQLRFGIQAVVVTAKEKAEIVLADPNDRRAHAIMLLFLKMRSVAKENRDESISEDQIPGLNLALFKIAGDIYKQIILKEEIDGAKSKFVFSMVEASILCTAVTFITINTGLIFSATGVGVGCLKSLPALIALLGTMALTSAVLVPLILIVAAAVVVFATVIVHQIIKKLEHGNKAKMIGKRESDAARGNTGEAQREDGLSYAEFSNTSIFQSLPEEEQESICACAG